MDVKTLSSHNEDQETDPTKAKYLQLIEKKKMFKAGRTVTLSVVRFSLEIIL